MKARSVLWIALLVVFASGAMLAQDPLKVDPTHYKLVFENAGVRILKIDYAAGDKSRMHQHPDAIVIPLVASKVRFTTPDGKTEDVDLASESPMYTPAVTHSPANIGAERVDGLLVEFKSPKPGTSAMPASRDGMGMKKLAEGPRAEAYRMTAAATFEEAAGSKHDYDQIVIALGASQMSLAIDGKPAKTTWARGDAQFIGRGVPHASKNTGGQPVDFIIVYVK
jgi:beta-alanine degradation protein BauB